MHVLYWHLIGALWFVLGILLAGLVNGFLRQPHKGQYGWQDKILVMLLATNPIAGLLLISRIGGFKYFSLDFTKPRNLYSHKLWRSLAKEIVRKRKDLLNHGDNPLSLLLPGKRYLLEPHIIMALEMGSDYDYYTEILKDALELQETLMLLFAIEEESFQMELRKCLKNY